VQSSIKPRAPTEKRREPKTMRPYIIDEQQKQGAKTCNNHYVKEFDALQPYLEALECCSIKREGRWPDTAALLASSKKSKIT